MTADATIGDCSTYLIDFDNEIKGDINHAIKKKYSGQSLVLSWDSSASRNPNFTETLSASVIKADENSIDAYHHYKVIKAGFTAISPSLLGSTLLFLIEFAIRDNCLFCMRLFLFTFCDQIAMLLAVRDIYLDDQLKQKISWIDIHASNIVSTNPSRAEYMLYPKSGALPL